MGVPLDGLMGTRRRVNAVHRSPAGVDPWLRPKGSRVNVCLLARSVCESL